MVAKLRMLKSQSRNFGAISDKQEKWRNLCPLDLLGLKKTNIQSILASSDLVFRESRYLKTN